MSDDALRRGVSPVSYGSVGSSLKDSPRFIFVLQKNLFVYFLF
jgi:hypothetical protein